MAQHKTLDWVVDQKFDRRSCRHYVNGTPMVLHCHHYTSNYVQLADDARALNGPEIMRKSTEASFLEIFNAYFAAHGITELADRVRLIEEYWRMSGMGLVRFERVGSMSAVARMTRSHVDEGWIKKWGKRKEPINFVGQGFLTAAMCAICGVPGGSFAVTETQSIVAGAESSLFTIVRA